MKALDLEICIIKRDYSCVRRRQNKWRYRGSEANDYIINLNNEEFLLGDLEKRLETKQNNKLLLKIYDLWKFINPFHIPGISRYVYYHILREIYKNLYKSQLRDEEIFQMTEQDMDLDFKGGGCMHFTEFYDAVFDIIDQHTFSKKISEYLSTVNSIIDLLKNSQVFNELNLHNKLHCQGTKARYYLWMKEILGINSKKKLQKSKPDGRHFLPKIKSVKSYYSEKINPLSIQRKSGIIDKFILEDIIQGRNTYLVAHKQNINKPNKETTVRIAKIEKKLTQ